jgi:hypothetical protein
MVWGFGLIIPIGADLNPHLWVDHGIQSLEFENR